MVSCQSRSRSTLPGASVAGEWIEPSGATYPCLIDERHIVADLYGVTNVPSAVWINEDGTVARSTENCGSSDAWRFAFDRVAGEMPSEAADDATERHRIYFDAVRDWAERGRDSRHVRDAPAAATSGGSDADQARASACFLLATHLRQSGNVEGARRWMAEAASLAPRSWRIKREHWTLDDPGNLFAGDFWLEVDALGDERYYDPPAIEGMPAQAKR